MPETNTKPVVGTKEYEDRVYQEMLQIRSQNPNIKNAVCKQVAIWRVEAGLA